MAINKKLIHFNKFTTFNSKKLSANSDNTQYTLGVNGTVTTGSPEINYHSIVYIKDRKQIWTHGQLYDGNESPVIVLDDISDAGSTGDLNYIYYDRNACKLFGWDVYIEDYVELAPSTACLGETFADENPFITEKLLEGNLDNGSSYGPSLLNVNLYNMVTNILNVVKSASGGNYTLGFVKVNYSTYTFYAWVSGNGVYTQTNLNDPITECTTKIYFITINNHIAELGIYDTNGYIYTTSVDSHYNLIKGHDVATATKAGLMSADDKTELEKLRGLYSKMSGLTYTFTSGSQTATIDGVSTTLQSGTEYPVLWSLKNELTGDVTIEMVRPSFNFMNDMSGMFSSCGDLTSLNLDKFNTDHVYKMDMMFSNCKALTSLSLDGFKTNEVTSFLRMFQNCSSLTSLNLFTFNTSKATTMMGMFHGCSNLTEIIGDSLTTENVSNFGNMFYGCSKLTSLSWMFDTSKATTMANMFSGCSSLTTLDMSGFDFSKVAGVANMFKGCTSLSLITKAPSNIGVDLDMSECPLTAGSAVFIIAGLKNVSETKTLKLKASTYSALTTAQIKVATDKGWTVTSV